MPNYPHRPSITADEARARIDSLCHAVSETEQLPIADALGRVLAEDVASPVNVPEANNSAMDGYAMPMVPELSGLRGNLLLDILLRVNWDPANVSGL